MADEWSSYHLDNIIHNQHGLGTILGTSLELPAAMQCKDIALPLVIGQPNHEIPAALPFHFSPLQCTGSPSRANFSLLEVL